MHRRWTWLGLCRVAFVLVASLGLWTSEVQAEIKPNFLLIVADDATWRDFGFTGNREVRTPNLDRLATEGMQLTNVYTPATTCSPSRHALYTGLYPIRSGAYPNHTRVYDGTKSMFTHFKDRGYRVGLQLKSHVGPAASFPYEPIGKEKDDFTATEEFLRRDGNEPWLLVFASNDPHSPWDRGEKGVPDPASLTVPPYLHDNQVTRKLLADYYREIHKLDWQVGELMRLLDETDQAEQTLVMFVSEQGSSFPYGGKWSLYDNGIRVATLARWPGKIPPGSKSEAMVQYVDVPPTFLEAAGFDPSEIDVGCPDVDGRTGFDGRSFLSVLTGESKALRDYVFAQHTTVGINGYLEPYPMRAVRDTRYKLIRNLAPENTFSIGGIHKGQPIESWRVDAKDNPALAERIKWLSHRPAEELYDLQSDEYEERNLADDPQFAAVKARLSQQLDAWMLQQGDKGMETELKAESRQGDKRAARVAPVAAGQNSATENRNVPQSEGKPRRKANLRINSSDLPAINQGGTWPRIDNTPITVTVEGLAPSPQGVLVAIGGSLHGVAVHLVENHPAFDVRIAGKVTRIKSPEPVKRNFLVQAALTAEWMILSVDGVPVAQGPSPGLIPQSPRSPLSVGWDESAPAGDYVSPNPFNGTIVYARVDTDDQPPTVSSAMSRETLVKGLASHDRALFIQEGWIRDPYIVRGPDGWYYLTGTTPNPGDSRELSDPYNSGLGSQSLVGWQVRVSRSKDLIEWESLGSPFTLKDGAWFKENLSAFETTEESQWFLWAPELHWLGDRWALVHTSPSPVKGANLSVTQGAELSGPWSNPLGIKIGRRHDPSLFRDDDGTWWMVWGATEIAPLKPDFSDFAAKPIPIGPTGETAKMGHEGCLIQKIHGQYVLFGTGWSTGNSRRGSYNLYYATAKHIEGPYSERKFVGRFLGHGTPFLDEQKRWWCTAFYNANVPPLLSDGIVSRDLRDTAQTINQRGTTIVPLDVRLLSDGQLFIGAKDPNYGTPGPDEVQKFGTK